MSETKGTRGGKRPGAGNPGYGRVSQILKNVEKHMPLWWEEWEKMFHSGLWEERKCAIQEFNKLQVKVIPTDIESGGKSLVIKFDPTFHVIASETTGDSDESSEI